MTFRLALTALVLAFAFAASAQTAAPPVRMKIASPFVLGKADAPLTMIEFSDYECSFCQQYHATAFAEIKRAFIDTGKLRYVVRDYPLPFHRNAIHAARATRCAAEQGRYWEMRGVLFANVERLDIDAMVAMGGALKLDETALRTCILNSRNDPGIRKDIIDANAAGVNSTPTFVIGRSRGDSVEGALVTGSQPFAAYEARIKALLGAP